MTFCLVAAFGNTCSQGFIWPAMLSLNSDSFQHWRSFSLSICKETLLTILDHQCIKEYATEMSQVRKSALKSALLHWNAIFTIWPERRFYTWKKENSYKEHTRFTTLGLASHYFRCLFNISHLKCLWLHNLSLFMFAANSEQISFWGKKRLVKNCQ